MAQGERILRYMEEHGSITPMEAASELGVMRLGARIWDLRAAGHPINARMVAGRNRFGDKTRYAEYSIKKEG